MTVLMLRYRGGGAFRPGLPARDIDHAELAAMAAAHKTSVDAIAEEAVGSGLYLAVLDVPDVPRGTVAPAEPTNAQLRERAAALGLEPKARANKAELVAAIEAEEARLAEEAAASSSGEREALAAVLAERTDDELAALAAEAGLEGGLSRDAVIAALVARTEGDATPGDDPGAVASGEPGTPPAGGAGG